MKPFLPWIALLAIFALGCDSTDLPSTLEPGLYVTLFEGESFSIYRLESGKDQLILPNASDFSISPQRQQILFTRLHHTTIGSTLNLYDANSGKTQSLGTFMKRRSWPMFGQTVFGYDPRWSPNGQKLSFYDCPRCESAEPGALILYDIEAGREDTLMLPNARYTDHAWSPSGSFVAVSSSTHEGGQWHRWLNIFEVSTLRLVSRFEFPASPLFAWDHEGRLVVVDDSDTLVWYSIDGLELERREVPLSDSSSLSYPLLFTSDRTIIGTSYQEIGSEASRRLYDYNMQTGALRLLVESENGFLAQIVK